MNYSPNTHKIWTACKVLSATRVEFTLEDIAVACFKEYPGDFQMRGHKYPDTRKISTYIFGRGNIVDKGYIIKVTKTTFKLGIEPKQIQVAAPVSTPAAAQKMTAIERWGLEILQSVAAKKLAAQMPGSLTTMDVMYCLKVRRTSGLRKNTLEDALENLRLLDTETDSRPEWQPRINQIRYLLDRFTPIIEKQDRMSAGVPDDED